jgi:hypothetical protein
MSNGQNDWSKLRRGLFFVPLCSTEVLDANSRFFSMESSARFDSTRLRDDTRKY